MASFEASNLKGKGDLLQDQVRDRDHQNQKSPGEQDRAKECPSLKQNDQAGQQDEQRHPREKQFRAQDSQNQHKQAQHHQRKTGP